MNESNLKPCKPGEVRNPKGRPKGTLTKDVNALVEEIGAEKIRKSINKKQMYITQLEAVIRMIYKSASGGKLEAQKFIVERLGGKAKQTIAVENPLDREWLETYKRIKNGAIDKTRKHMDSG